MASFGNAGSISSLLNSAQAARKRQESLQDSLAAYEWDLSNKDQADYAKYVQHLSERMNAYGNDPARALEYQKKVTSVQRGFTSAEIGRVSTQILYGNGNNRDKYAKVAELFQSAIANGDENLASRLESQAARLSVTIQNEEEAAARASEAASARGRAAVTKQYTEKIQDVDRDFKDLESQLNNGELSITEYAKLKSVLYNKKVEVLTGAASDPNIEADKQNDFISKIEDVSRNDDFKKWAGSGARALQAAFDDKGNYIPERNPYRIKVDPITGERTIENNKIVGATGGNNPLNIFNQPQVDLGNLFKSGNPQDMTIQRKISKDFGSPVENFRADVFSSAKNPALQEQQGKLGNFGYYVDPVTGQEIVLNADGTRTRLKDATETADFKAEQAKKNDMEGNFGSIGDIFKPKNLVQGAINSIPGVGPLNNIINMYAKQKYIKEEEAKKAAIESARVAAEQNQRRIAEQAAAQRVLAPLPPAKVSYSPLTGVKAGAPYDAAAAAARIAKETGTADPVIKTYLSQPSPFGAGNVYGKPF